jgi:SAM-dependent methyltransferase
MSIHLDLGCGPIPRNPYGRAKLCGIDIRADLQLDPAVEIAAANLSCEPIPYPDNHFDSVSAYEFLEHVPRVSLDHASKTTHFPFIELMNEVWRVLKPGGLFYAVTPAYPHTNAFVDPTHVNYLTTRSSRYFVGADPLGRMYGFKGRFSVVRQGMIRSRGDYHPVNPGLLLRLRAVGYRLSGDAGQLLWELKAEK